MIEVITCQYMSLLHHPDHAVVSILPACLLLTLESQGDTDWVGQVIRQQEDGLLLLTVTGQSLCPRAQSVS